MTVETGGRGNDERAKVRDSQATSSSGNPVAGSDGISRRSLLKGAAAGFAGLAALGIAGCGSSETDSNKNTSISGISAEVALSTSTVHSWDVVPDPIDPSDIVDTVETQVLIIGGGYAGCCCAAAAAEAGAQVILIEKDDVLNGNSGGTGAIKSSLLDALDIENDKALEQARWVSACGNRCRESLVSKWFRESERCMNWLIDLARSDGARIYITAGSASTVHPECTSNHVISGGNSAEAHSDATALEYLFESLAEAHGGQFIFQMPAVRLLTDTAGSVTGAICVNADDEYIQFNASVGVVLATGDISGDYEMLSYFAPMGMRAMECANEDPGETGDGHRMAHWVGGAFQEEPWPTMMRPQAGGYLSGPFLCVDPRGRRFMNEATSPQGKCAAIIENASSDHAWAIFDANWASDLAASLPYGGGMFWDIPRDVESGEWYTVEYYRQLLSAGIRTASDSYKQADTIVTLAEDIGIDPIVLQATIDRYNLLCDAGEDTDFFKDPHLMTPVRQAPFFAVKVGVALLCVPAGIHISDDFEVLDDFDAPIPGLYAIGNCSGDIYALDYPTNVPGHGYGWCLVEGKCLGEALGAKCLAQQAEQAPQA